MFYWKIHTPKIHTKLHLGPPWRIFHNLTCKNIDDVFSHVSQLFANSQLVYMIIKLQGGLKM